LEKAPFLTGFPALQDTGVALSCQWSYAVGNDYIPSSVD
jgi:hypothetical protein